MAWGVADPTKHTPMPFNALHSMHRSTHTYDTDRILSQKGAVRIITPGCTAPLHSPACRASSGRSCDTSAGRNP